MAIEYEQERHLVGSVFAYQAEDGQIIYRQANFVVGSESGAKVNEFIETIKGIPGTNLDEQEARIFQEPSGKLTLDLY